MLCAYILITVMYFDELSTLSLCTIRLCLLFLFFGSKSVFSGMNMAIPTFFWLKFAWSIIIHPFTVYTTEVSFLEATYSIWILYFNPFSHPESFDSIHFHLEWWIIDEDLVLTFYLLFSCSKCPFFPFPYVSICHFGLVVFYNFFFSVSSCFMLHVSALYLCFEIFMFWGYYEVYIKHLIALFLLIVSLSSFAYTGSILFFFP